MDETARTRFLEQPFTAVLSTLNADGTVHAVPVWYLFRSGELRVITERGSQKHRNCVRAGRATLCVDQRDGAFRYVTAEGPVSIIDPLTREQRRELHTNYVGAEEAERRTADNAHEAMVMLVLHPEKWLGLA